MLQSILQAVCPGWVEQNVGAAAGWLLVTSLSAGKVDTGILFANAELYGNG